MPFDIDVPTGGGNNGPFVQWQAAEAKDASTPGRVWIMREKEGKSIFKGFEQGVVLDMTRLKTGWCYSTGTAGTAPEWLWNASVSKFAPMPPARPGKAMWKKGLSVPLAYSPTQVAVWEQAQAGAWSAFAVLAKAIMAANSPAGKLPVVKQDGVEKIETSKGITFAPKLIIVKWVDCPDILSAAAVDAGADDDDVPF